MHLKRGQATRILIYVMTLVVVGLILLFGYKSISSLVATGGKAQVLKFKNEFSNAVERGSSFGRVSTHDFSVSGDYEALCLVNNDMTSATVPSEFQQYPLVLNAIESGNNAFLVSGSTIDPFTVASLELAGGGDCFVLANGVVRLQFEGKGDRTAIREGTV